MSDVLCMGELLAEFVSSTPNASLADASGFVRAPGGAPANVAVGVSRLGLSSGFIGKVGNDPFGDYLRRSLREANVETQGLLTDESARTTAVFVAVWDDGHKDLCFYRNPGADMMLTPAELDLSLIRTARCLHFGSIGLIDEPTASAQVAAVEAARASGAMITYDPNYRPTLWESVDRASTVIRDAYRFAHLAKISEEEWEIATGTTDLRAGARSVLDAGPEIVVISRGASGAIATNGDYWIDLPTPTVDVVETTGAGDGFLAAMIVKLLPWREKLGSLAAVSEAVVRDALDYANSVGALTCTRMGAIPALPTAAEVDAFRSTTD